MKILKEIEKSRLTEDGMNDIQGGAGIGENCSSEAIYEVCGKGYSYAPCAMKLSCDSRYFYCTGSGAADKLPCISGYWVTCPKQYNK